MKSNKKHPFTSVQIALFCAVLLILSPVILLALLFIVGKMLIVYVPALREIQTVPRYWLTWKHVKLLTGLTTANTLGLLVAFTDGIYLECRLREADQLERINRLRKDVRIPTGKQPYFREQVIYYEFRMVWRGGRKWPNLKEIGSRLFGALEPKPALQPAYAR